jgi:hypothetical protein
MTPKTITIQLVKNLGNYESCRLQLESDINPEETVKDAFLQAQATLLDTFNTMYPPTEKKELKTLYLESPEFDRVCAALHAGRVDIARVKENFILSYDVIDYLKKNNLWNI